MPLTLQVRKRLMQKQIGQQISERVKKIREIKKYGKKVQIEVEQQKHKEKREMLEKIKKFRKVRIFYLLLTAVVCMLNHSRSEYCQS